MGQKTKAEKLNKDKNFWAGIQTFLAIAIVCLCTVFIIMLLYYFDNKYTAPEPLEVDGVLHVDNKALEKQPIFFLVKGWTYYGGKLLEPEDLKNESPDEIIYIGQYGGFEAGDLSKTPHGSATYGITIKIPDKEKKYALKLPEIFSSYKAYINGKLVQQMGEPDADNYRAETGNRVISFDAKNEIQILIAVTDYSHFYSGMVYPPAFGQPDAINKLMNTQIIFRSILVAFAFAIGILALLYGIISNKRRQTILYGVLCLFFVGYASYPIFQNLFGWFYPLYTIEMFSFCAMLLVVIMLQRTFYYHKFSNIFMALGFIMCGMSLVLPLFVSAGSLLAMAVYSYGIVLYEWSTAIYLLWSFALAYRRKLRHSQILLYGILMFTTTLIMDRILFGYEPIITAWFPELASFALVLCIGMAVVKETADKYKEGVILSERMDTMESLMDIQRSSYDLLRGQIASVKIARHDLRHHLVLLESFTKQGDYEKLKTYLKDIQSDEIYDKPLTYSQNAVIDVLLKHYMELAKRTGIELIFEIDTKADIKISEVDLCVVLSNLLENAMEACGRQNHGKSFIKLSIKQKLESLTILMKNSTDGNISEDGKGFMSSKGENRKGYGLESVQSVAEQYGGYAEFRNDEEENIFISLILMMEK